MTTSHIIYPDGDPRRNANPEARAAFERAKVSPRLQALWKNRNGQPCQERAPCMVETTTVDDRIADCAHDQGYGGFRRL